MLRWWSAWVSCLGSTVSYRCPCENSYHILGLPAARFACGFCSYHRLFFRPLRLHHHCHGQEKKLTREMSQNASAKKNSYQRGCIFNAIRDAGRRLPKWKRVTRDNDGQREGKESVVRINVENICSQSIGSTFG